MQVSVCACSYEIMSASILISMNVTICTDNEWQIIGYADNCYMKIHMLPVHIVVV